jgi:hypothetical protein
MRPGWTIWIIKLSVDRPGTKAGPEDPPARTFSAVVRSNPPRIFPASEWHETQFLMNTCLTLANESDSTSAARVLVEKQHAVSSSNTTLKK